MGKLNIKNRHPLQRPSLTKSISEEDLLNFYWLKQELVVFCRENGLSTAGGKFDIRSRIQEFLRTGHRTSPSSPLTTNKVFVAPQTFSLADRVPNAFRCTREARDFFVSQVGPTFHYSVKLQYYIKANPGITFQELLNKWQEHKDQKKTATWKSSIGPQFEYNQFTRDFFNDPKNKDKSRADCIEAWKQIRVIRGERKYRPS